MVPNIANVRPHGSRVKNVNRKKKNRKIDFIKTLFQVFSRLLLCDKKMKNHELKSDSLFAKFPSEACF